MVSDVNRWLYVDIPLMDYREAWQLQLALVDARGRGVGLPDVLIVLEHPPVFTLGRRGARENVTVAEPFLQEQGIPVIPVERGGDVTFHGPGQLVVYPIVDLRVNGWKVVDFVGALEEVMIRIAGEWGIQAGRNALNRGVWVGMEKLGSVGIAVRRGVSFHGFALNVNTDLEAFGWIRPCGLHGIRATSMERILGERTPMSRVRVAARRHCHEVFGVNLEERNLQEIRRLVKTRTLKAGEGLS
jgi:lipoate-protein ligase B